LISEIFFRSNASDVDRVSEISNRNSIGKNATTFDDCEFASGIGCEIGLDRDSIFSDSSPG
jgi:hypothetical protein